MIVAKSPSLGSSAANASLSSPTSQSSSPKGFGFPATSPIASSQYIASEIPSAFARRLSNSVCEWYDAAHDLVTGIRFDVGLRVVGAPHPRVSEPDVVFVPELARHHRPQANELVVEIVELAAMSGKILPLRARRGMADVAIRRLQVRPDAREVERFADRMQLRPWRAATCSPTQAVTPSRDRPRCAGRR